MIDLVAPYSFNNLDDVNRWTNLLYRFLNYSKPTKIESLNVQYVGSLETAITNLGTEPVELWIDVDTTIANNTTVPSNVYLRFFPDCVVTVNSSKTLTIYSPANVIASPNQQIFSGAGTVVFTNKEIVYIEWWGGGVGATAAANDTALDAAEATGCYIVMLGGTYNFAAAHTLSDVPILKGIPNITILKPSAAVTTVFLGVNTTLDTDTGYNHPCVIDGISLDGTAATTATGIKPGAATSGNILFRNVEAYGFAVGLHIADVVNFTTDHCNFAKNGCNKIDASAASLPTMVRLNKTNFRESKVTLGTGHGLEVTHGYDIVSDHCTYESNDKEGLEINTANGKRTSGFTSTHDWFENNHASEGTPANFFHIVVGGAGYTEFNYKGGVISFESPASKAMSLTAVSNFCIEMSEQAGGTQSGMFSFASACIGKLVLPRAFSAAWTGLITSDGSNSIDVSANWNQEILTANEHDPSFIAGVHFKTANTSPLNFNAASMLDTYIGQKFDIMFDDANTTVLFAIGTSQFIGNGNVDWKPARGDWMECEVVDGAWLSATKVIYCTIHIIDTPSEQCLSATTVAFNSIANTLLYTVPAGHRCVLTKVVVVAGADAGATQVKITGAASGDFLDTQTLSNLDAQYDAVILQPIPNATPVKLKSYGATQTVTIEVLTNVGGATNTVYLFGVLY